MTLKKNQELCAAITYIYNSLIIQEEDIIIHDTGHILEIYDDPDVFQTLSETLSINEGIISSIFLCYGKGQLNAPPTSLSFISSPAVNRRANIKFNSIINKFTNITDSLPNVAKSVEQVDSIKSTLKKMKPKTLDEKILQQTILKIDSKVLSSKLDDIHYLNFKLKTNQIKLSEYLQTLGGSVDIKYRGTIDNFYKGKASKLFPEANDFEVKKITGKVMDKTNPQDVLTADALKNSKNYPTDASSIDRVLTSNKSINQIERAIVKKVNKKRTLKTIRTKFFTYSIVGGVAFGFFKLVVQPWLLDSSGCHINYCDDSIVTKRRSRKILEYSCVNKQTTTYTQVSLHPFHQEIVNWEQSHNEKDHIVDYNGQDNYETLGFTHCSDEDVKTYGPCGGWGTPQPGYPLTLKFNMENIEEGTSISCDDAPNIFEAVTDIALSAGVDILDVGLDVAGNTIRNVFIPCIAILLILAVCIFFTPTILNIFLPGWNSNKNKFDIVDRQYDGPTILGASV